MTETINIPLWLVVICGALATWAFLDHLMLPSVRWFLRRRANILMKKINECLDLELPPFKLTKRRILIDRLIYDTRIIEAAKAYSREHDVPNEVAMEKVQRFSREIVPSFNAYFYFRLANWLNKSLARLLYRVRIGFTDENGLAKMNPQSSVVFIMNHRSNMDYLLLAYLAISRVALSFAVGEWARIWPVQQLVRATGAFFVRRGSGDTLYRQVLARYVQMATESGVVQVIFPEGRLSRDGGLGDPKIGLLDYILRDFDPNKERDLVFIPVGVNYDRVLEDRSQLQNTDPCAEKKSGFSAIKTVLFFFMRNLWLMSRGRWHRFGYAVVNFGAPFSIREYLKVHKFDFRNMTKKSRIKKVQLLASKLIDEVGKVIPVVPVSLVAHIFSHNPDKTFSDLELKARVQSLIDELEKRGAHVYIPRSDRDYAVEVGLRMLTLRHLVLEENYLHRASPENINILHYYANSIKHFLD